MIQIFSRRHVIASALALSLLPLLPSESSAQSLQPISGHYTAHGRNPDGSTYVGQVFINEQNGGVNVAWTVGSQSYAGNGIREGRVVTVNWGSNAPVVYVVMPNRELHGTWSNGRALELLTPN